MNVIRWVVLFAAAGGIAVSAYMFRRSILLARSAPHDGRARFESRWLGVYAVGIGFVSCLGVSWVASTFMSSSWLAFAVVVAVNLPILLLGILFCWTSIRKIELGARGCVAYAWRRIPEEQLADVPAAERRRLVGYCVLQGIVCLAIGIAIIAAGARPLLEWAFGY